MLRGHIDVVSANRVAGWVYSDAASVTGRRVLVFSGEHCVGAGEVNVLRPDLKDAGLGDGWLGFDITIPPGAILDPATVHVRLDCSDFSLFEPRFYSRLGHPRQGHLHLYTPEEEARVEWMSRQGWLSQEQFTGLKALNALGWHQRAFSRAELTQCPLETRAATVYAEVVSALFRREVSLDRLEIEPITGDLGPFDPEQHWEVFGIFGGEFEFEVQEGAHQETMVLDDASPCIMHRTTAYQVLLIHAGCLRRLLPGKKQSQLRGIRARR